MYFDFGTHDLSPRRFDLGLRRADVLRGARDGVLRRRGLRSHRLRLRPDDDLDNACALVHHRALAHEHALHNARRRGVHDDDSVRLNIRARTTRRRRTDEQRERERRGGKDFVHEATRSDTKQSRTNFAPFVFLRVVSCGFVDHLPRRLAQPRSRLTQSRSRLNRFRHGLSLADAPDEAGAEGAKALPLVKESDGCCSRTSSSRGVAPLITATLLASSVLPMACWSCEMALFRAVCASSSLARAVSKAVCACRTRKTVVVPARNCRCWLSYCCSALDRTSV